MQKLNARQQASGLRVTASLLLLLALGAAPILGADSEAAAYQGFLEGSYEVRIPAAAIDPYGTVVLHFGVPDAPRGLTLELDVSDAGPGTYSLDLGATYPLVTPTLDGEGRGIERAELAELLATPDFFQNVFCRRDDGTGGAVAWGTVPLTAADGTSTQVGVMISNDGLAHDDQYTLEQCSAGIDAVPFERAGLYSSADDGGDDEMVWCISWFSSMCFDKGPRMRRCDGEKCDITMSALVGLAGEAGLEIPGGMLLEEAVDWLSRKLGVAIGGYCAKVYFLGWFSVGCQCVLHTF